MNRLLKHFFFGLLLKIIAYLTGSSVVSRAYTSEESFGMNIDFFFTDIFINIFQGNSVR